MTIVDKHNGRLVEIEKIIKNYCGVYIIGKHGEEIYLSKSDVNAFDICRLANELKDVKRVRGTYYGGLPRYR